MNEEDPRRAHRKNLGYILFLAFVTGGAACLLILKTLAHRLEVIDVATAVVCGVSLLWAVYEWVKTDQFFSVLDDEDRNRW